MGWHFFWRSIFNSLYLRLVKTFLPKTARSVRCPKMKRDARAKAVFLLKKKTAFTLASLHFRATNGHYGFTKLWNYAFSEMISTHYELCSKYSHICHESFRIVKIAGLLLRFTASSFQLILMDLLASCVFVISIINNKKNSAITKHSNLCTHSFVTSFLKILGMTGCI